MTGQREQRLSLRPDAEAVFGRMRARKSLLRIVLKTKDDPYFIESWIKHHAAIVGAENLVILDNGSTDHQVLAAYQASSETPVLRMEGFYNDVHRPWMAPELYSALREISDYFVFLDTDEFLWFHDGEHLIADARIPQFLADCDGDFVLTTRLNGVPLYRDRFVCGTDAAVLRDGAKWGKPIVRAQSTGWPAAMNHNVHLRGAMRPDVRAGFFVLHLPYLHPEQRIKSNLAKLEARGFLSAGEGVEQAVTRDPSNCQPIVRVLVEEIRRMTELTADAKSPAAPLAEGVLRVESKGSITFGSPETRRAFEAHGESFASVVSDVLTLPPGLRVNPRIVDHKLVECVFCESPNRGREITPRFLVMHFTSTFDAPEAIRILTDANSGHRVSAHVVLGADGMMTQLVPFNIAAWHAGDSRFDAGGESYVGLNAHSIGIEVVNPGWFIAEGGVFLHEGRKACTAEQLAPFPGTIEGHLPDGRSARWACYPETQLDVLERLVCALLKQYPTIRNIVGHDQIAPVRKVDPGPAFPMARFVRLIDENA